jgi:hypothetical protein
MESTDNVQPNINISSDSFEKGLVREGKTLIAWDAIQECYESCPIHQDCKCKPAKEKSKCIVQVQYLTSLTDMIFRTYRYLNDDVLYKIGMHIVPLYSMLCRQKIVEKSVVNITYEDNKGVTRVHPIYKEIRETMRMILDSWKSIGVLEMPNPNLPNAANMKQGFGDPNHYANISRNENNKEGIVR